MRKLIDTPEAEERRRYAREYYKNNKDKLKLCVRRYKDKNPEKVCEWNRNSIRKVRALDPGRMLRDRKRYRDRDPVRYLFLHAQARAKKAGIVFTLSRDDIVIPEFCPVLGLKLEWGVGRRASANRNSPSVDRIVPELGYVPGNVRVISNRANHLKNNATAAELMRVALYAAAETGQLEAV